MLPDRIEPMLSVMLLFHSTPALPVLPFQNEMFENISQFTEYLQYFLKIYSLCLCPKCNKTYGNLIVRIISVFQDKFFFS